MMNILESLIYGLISGLSEFLPISSQGHQALLKYLFGATSPEPIREIMVHIAMLVAVYIANGTYLDRIKRERKIRTSRKRGIQADRTITQDLRLIRTAGFPMLIGIILLAFTSNLGNNLGWLSLFFVISGIILYIPEHLPHANKTAGQLGPMDSLLIGLFGGLSCLPGVSRIGGSVSYAIARGADQAKAYNWVLVLSIPALILLIILDIVSIFFTGFGMISFMSVLGYLIAAIAAFAASFAGIYVMRKIIDRSGITFFAFYCWGTAFLSCFLYLFT